MTNQRDPDAIIADWLEEGPLRLPEATRRAIAVSARTSRQSRRLFFAPLRSPTMNPTAKLLAAAIVMVVAIGGVAYAIAPRNTAGGVPPVGLASPSQSPAPTGVASPSPSPVSTAGWLPFTSAWYGFTAAYPPGYTLHQATLHWNLVRDQTVFQDATDSFTDPTGWPQLQGYETRLPSGTTSDAFIQQYIAPNLASNCYQTPELWKPVTVDGHPSRVAHSGCNQAYAGAEAIVVVGDRIYWFGMHGTDEELLTAYLSTVRIHPETAVDETIQASATP